jgi:hypothetical protein
VNLLTSTASGRGEDEDEDVATNNIRGGCREDGIDVELVVVLSPQGRKKKMASLL